MFLTLVGLTALLVGGVGVANAVKNYLDGKRATIATLKCLGAPGTLIIRIYFAQIMILAVIGVAAGMAIGAVVPAIAGPLVASQIGVAVRTGLYPGPLLLAAAFGVLTATAFSLWPLARAREIPPAALFRDLVAPERRWPRFSYIALTALAIAGLAALTIGSAVDKKLAAGFVVAAAATFVLFRAAAWAIAAAARRVRGLRRPGLRLAFANMHRPGSPTGGIVMSLGIGLTVLVVITQVHGNFARELREQIPAIAPTFFFIDIQPDQVAAFDQIMRMPGVRHMQRVPSLRARITALNGVPVETARIQADVRWATGSDRGLTYSTTPPEGSRVVAGEWWPADYSGPPLISFDANLARGMGLGVGDTMTFNVLGVEIEARIANLRAIDWSSLGINFTTVFAPGALEGAPQTWLATASVAPEAEDEIERLVTEQLPNASTIRVRAALATIDAMLGTISDAAGLTAGLTLVAGTLVLAGAMAASQRRRIYDAVVLKVLGARRRDVVAAFLIEFGLIGLAAAVVASAIGTVCAYVLWGIYLRVPFVFLPQTVIAVAVFAVLLVGGLGLAGTWRALGQKSAPVLRNA
jgi:putative ABC transport system permease protein